MKRSCLLSPLLLIVVTIAFEPTSLRADKGQFQDISDPTHEGQDWTAVAASERPEILRFIGTQVKDNAEKIRTWKGEYEVQRRDYWSEKFVARFKPRLPDNCSKDLMAETTIKFRFSIDFEEDRVFREMDSTKFATFTTDKYELVEIPDVRPADYRSVVAPDDYIRFGYKDAPSTRSVVSGWPQATQKPSALRESPEDARQEGGFGSLLDPRLFFNANGEQTVWEQFELYASRLADPGSPFDALIVETSRGDSGLWYRLKFPLPGNPGTGQIAAYWVFSPQAGYNVVASSMLSADNGPVSVIATSWQQYEGVYLPNHCSHIVYGNGASKLPTTQIEASLGESSVNVPVSDDFGYRALGLKDGDLVLDEERRVAYLVSGDTIERLCDYGEVYHPGAIGRLRGWARRFWIPALSLGLVTVIFLLYFRRPGNR